MEVARVNEIASTNACFTLQALTLKFKEELGLLSSNGVAGYVNMLYGVPNTFRFPGNNVKMLPLKLAGDVKGQMLDQGKQMETWPCYPPFCG